MDTRNASKEFADKVLSDLTSDLASLESAKIPSGSSYVEQAEKVMELYECQIGRVSALTNAWALDVTFETPSEHKAEDSGQIHRRRCEDVSVPLRRALLPG